MLLHDLTMYINRCAPLVTPSTMLALVKTESNGNHLAIGLNGTYKLKYQANNLTEASLWVNYLESHGYNFDVGLGQINIKNIKKYGYKPVDMLDPCKNLTVASDILYRNYHIALHKAENKSQALLHAISAYNSGNYNTGFSNGYVLRVLGNAGVNKLKLRSNEINHKRSVIYVKPQY